jgi:hypothetical protein
MFFLRSRGILPAIALVIAATGMWAESGADTRAPMLSSAQIVEQMQLRSQERAQDLKQYKALRHYLVEYRGFSTTVAAKMDVEVAYNASTGKSFQIVSQSGSKFLCEKVLKRAVESEKEASEDRGSTALTTANYRFQLAGSEDVGGRPTYILDVEPLKATKFLYRGKIWVDAADFAVAKMETEPAKNPSFWISRTLIHGTNVKTEGFWLPQKVLSETKVRVGGTAVLTIDYGTYQIGPKAP